jgi:hypothetical protein
MGFVGQWMGWKQMDSIFWSDPLVSPPQLFSRPEELGVLQNLSRYVGFLIVQDIGQCWFIITR